MKNVLGGLALAAATLIAEGDAMACGGCFTGPVVQTADSVVTGHRMAFALSPGRTVLWDQIKFSGNPSEFGWVLPVSHGAYIQASTDAWFETLDAMTTVQVTSPPLICASTQGSGIGCGSSSKTSALAGDSAGSNFFNQVNVLHEGTVGPYETVTLSSTDGTALRSWLSGHGYVVTPEIQPVIDSYVAEGSDFIALRLIPGQGVSSMTPVRVVTPNGPAMLPLRMVAAGTGSYVDIVLFVIGEGRYKLDDFTETHVDSSNLTFDFQTSKSNYLTLRADALGQNNGYSFITAFATGSPFASTPSSFTGPSYVSAQSLPDLYFAQAASDDNNTLAPGCSSVSAYLDSSLLVADGGGATLEAAKLTCNGYSDIAAAVAGMHPNRVWLTRLEMNLPHEALSADCKVSLATHQNEQSKDLVAVKVVGRPVGCPEPVFQSGLMPPIGTPGTMFAWSVGSFAALLFLRRSRNRLR